MSRIIFNFETSNGVELRVWLETTTAGTYDDPGVELDGDALVELIHTPDVPEFLLERAAFTELTTPVKTLWPMRERLNPAFRATPIDVQTLTDADQARLDAAIERELDAYLDSNSCEISQSIAEHAGDAYHDWLKEQD